MIDRETVDKILDTADIVEVVSDFVHLRRRGSNYVGLCPFHNEKTPSFSVSKSKGICKCFSCGKGGSAVNFIMEHEQMSYYEALKYLAKKYGIEVKERELTDEERQAQSERENMLNVNEFALQHFEKNLFETQDGKSIGLPYFYERQFTDATIKKFRLGYSSENRTDLYTAIKEANLNPKYAVETGLCIQGDHGIYDRFKGRVMFPVLNIAGKVIAFGGRTLKNDPAKYVNSPESIIYKKKNELYGLFQAKQAIVKKGKCFLVEGYTDVLSMHQAGIENVVASSGTSLTEGQIRMIHRFTDNITVLYDGDSAGIKASLRGIDLLLAEGLNVKVLLLPDGDDPDSFAKKHNDTEFQEFIESHETDFIKFKVSILLQGLENDPIKKAAAISDIVKSIAQIPSNITRAVYIKECSDRFEIDEKILTLEVQKTINVNLIKTSEDRRKAEEREKLSAIKKTQANDIGDESQSTTQTPVTEKNKSASFPLKLYETDIIRYIAKYGMCYEIFSISHEDGELQNVTLIEAVNIELENEGMTFSVPEYARLYNKALSLVDNFYEEYTAELQRIELLKEQWMQKGIEEIRDLCDSTEEIPKREKQLIAKIEGKAQTARISFQTTFLEKRLCSDPDDVVRVTATDLVTEKERLSKFHERHVKLETEYDRLHSLTVQAINVWKDAIISQQIAAITERIKRAYQSGDIDAVLKLMGEQQKLSSLRSQLISDRIIIP